MIKLVEPKIQKVEMVGNRGLFCVEPLERGFGLTLGNSLRRIMLSVISGAGIFYVKVGGVLHEFSNLPFIKEDTMPMLLNLREMPIRTTVVNPDPLKLRKKGKGEVKAGDFDPHPDIKILDPDHHIATIVDPKGELELEVGVLMYKGYLTVEQVHRQLEEDHKGWVNEEEGMIFLDVDFSPVKHVRFWVEETRVKDRSDYDKLFMEVRTNGCATPEEAISEAAKILRDHAGLFVDFEQRMLLQRQREQEVAQEKEALLKLSIEDLNLGQRALNCLRREGIRTVGEIMARSEEDLMNLKNFGEKSLLEIKEKIQKMGLSLKEDEFA